MAEKRKILAIDDAPMVLRALNEILKGDYDMLIAKNGEAGIESAKKNKPDLILLDLVMPGMSGFETLAFLKADPDTGDIPVVLITGSEMAVDEEKGYAQGAVDFIKKPFVGVIVKRRVSFVMEYIEMQRELKQLKEGQ
ncbi:MAG: response regulator [Clostridiales bacterium]|jgi:putative two-component system response regulator|nr:response regulator [Clostridiales bacterium]